MLVRAMSVFTVVVIGLTLLDAACGIPLAGPGSAPAQSAADAQATHVRRTALAEVQGIIANPRQPTPTPEPTSLPRPVCADAIWWQEARAHVNEVRTIQGPVLATRAVAPDSVLLEIGQPYPDPLGVSVVAPASSAQTYVGKSVCVVGRISADTTSPTVLVRHPERIMVTK
ncbi:MAG: hypothetical protein NVSMB2_01730 [Chloroflexota bacterium]